MQLEITALEKIKKIIRYEIFKKIINKIVYFYLRFILFYFACSIFFYPAFNYSRLIMYSLFFAVTAAYVYSFFIYMPGRREIYRALDFALELEERAVTYLDYSGMSENSIENKAVFEALKKDYFDAISKKSEIIENDRLFNERMPRRNFDFKTADYCLFILSCVLLFFILRYSGDIDIIERKNELKNEKTPAPAAAKEVKKVMDAIIEIKKDEIKVPDAMSELKKLKDKITPDLTRDEIAKLLKDTAANLKNEQMFKNTKNAADELQKIEKEANEFIAGKDGAEFSDSEKQEIKKKMDNLKRLVDEYLKSANNKEFDNIEKQLRELGDILNSKSDQMSAQMKEGKTGSGDSKQSGGKPQSGGNKMTAEQKSEMKQRNRMSGKEMLEKLKNDKQLQELYSAMMAMSDAVDSKKDGTGQGSQNAGGAGEKSGAQKEGGSKSGGKSGKGEKGGSEGEKGGNGEGGSQMSPQNFGINVPKPGKGSTNLKSEGSDAPLMAPQKRQADGVIEKKISDWKAFFDGRRFEVNAKSSQVTGAHNESAPFENVTGRSLPAPGAASAEVKSFINSEKSDFNSFVTSENVPDDMRKSVSDYFKKLNNDYNADGSSRK